MKCIIVSLLAVLVLVLFCSCRSASINLITTDLTEETRQSMDAEHALWHENKDTLFRKIEKELIDKGWSNLEVNIFSEARYMFLYQITGSVDDRYGNPMAVSVGIVFSEGVSEGKTDYVTYTSESGRWYGCSEILHANDQVLYEYMHDLSIPQIQ